MKNGEGPPVETANPELVESLYEAYKQNPAKLDSSWQAYFESLDQNVLTSTPNSPDQNQPLNELYRMYGHFDVKINPIKMDQESDTASILKQALTVHQVSPEGNSELRSLYCDRIGFEFKGLQNPELESWIQQRIESHSVMKELSAEQKKLILEYLNKSELFESFLHMKYVGQKRFSLEGGETLIPMLALLIETASSQGAEEFVIGMAHRGRLNVLSNILQKSHKEIFSEFDDNTIPESYEGMGDVKYHKGYASKVSLSQSRKVKIAIMPNPSHLESVDSVVEGLVRARQSLESDEKACRKIIPILIHGDAALAGQGVIYETLQLSRLPGYYTGGTVHFVINNQIGFTTIPRDLRSTPYCTDIARAFGCPILHVNCEDPEACVIATLFAFEIRQKFHIDVFIDLSCYRKYGHNESDEPAFTQPLEYQVIRKKRPIRELYRDQLIREGVVGKEIAEKLESEFKKGLQTVHTEVMGLKSEQPEKDLMEIPSDQLLFSPFPTGVPYENLLEIAKQLSNIPEGFRLHPKLENLIQERFKMVSEGKPIDWGMGETLAYATLLWEGISVRISGQDCCRGTFSHRHAVWVDQQIEQEYYPLANLKAKQGRFEIVNSPLSEAAVLGFEYGYSIANLSGLTIWEAQFGDFCNGAQVIIDQYIAGGEQKWGQKSGIVLLLPHGYEGQGPEHSSARMERFLALAGHDNIQVVNPTTPAQMFHLLRRQVLRALDKPLVVFTPKGLLRFSECVNKVEDFTQGAFQEILDDPAQPQKPNTMVLCSGRVYYDLDSERKKRKRTDIAIIRIEQLYPLAQDKLRQLLAKYGKASSYLWVQEEPKNMGAWGYISPYLQELVPSIHYVGRIRSATPATGSHSRHHQEYEHLINQVFEK